MGLQDQQGHGAGNPQGIHDDELAVRILGQKLFPGAVDRLQGAAEPAGESDEKQILFFQDRLEIIHIGRFVQGGGYGSRAAAHHIVIALMIQHLAEIVKVFFAVQRVGHIDDGNIIFLFQVKRQIAVAVGHEHISLFHGIASFGTK